MSERSTNENGQESKNKNIVFFLLLLLIVVTFLIASLTLLIFSYYSGNIFSRMALITGFLFLGLLVFVIVQTFINRQIVSKSKFPICHDMIEEFKLCARCKGFYVGCALFGILLGIKNTIYMDFLRTVGPYPYFVVMFLVLISVPVHGSLRRLKTIESSTIVLHIVGFVFSTSLFLIGNYIVYLFYGMS